MGEAGVGPQGGVDARLALRERRWVDDDDAEAATCSRARSGHHLERIADLHRVRARPARCSIERLQLHVAGRGGERRRRQMSTLCTERAPPAAACTLNPPVAANTSSTS